MLAAHRSGLHAEQVRQLHQEGVGLPVEFLEAERALLGHVAPVAEEDDGPRRRAVREERVEAQVVDGPPAFDPAERLANFVDFIGEGVGSTALANALIETEGKVEALRA